MDCKILLDNNWDVQSSSILKLKTKKKVLADEDEEESRESKDVGKKKKKIAVVKDEFLSDEFRVPEDVDDEVFNGDNSEDGEIINGNKAISFFFSPFWNIIDPYLNSLADLFSAQKAQRITIKSIFIFVAVSTLVSFAFLSYIAFYYVYIPKIAHSKPVHLQYHQDKLIHSMIDFTENGLYSDFLTADQAYDISIDLDVPESDRNIDLGNFMINLELKSKDNNTIQSSGRPCILTYKSKLLRITSTIWRLIPLVLGFVKEDQKLKVVMFENFIENGVNKNPEVYNANIQLDAHFRGLRYLMYYHYVSTGIAFILLFIFWEIFFSIFSWKIIVSQWKNSSSPSLKTIKYNDNGGVANNDDNGGVNNNGVQQNGKRKTLRNHPDEDEEQEENGGSEFVSNNDESSNISDNDSITSHSESMNPENTDYDESGFETTDVETPRRKLSRLSSNNDEEDNDD
ncbi:12228_t:CDS:10 [Entrophospora sp. SA101]|nr:12228_t:CDS:10 [Entrophospora sp. SA101]